LGVNLSSLKAFKAISVSLFGLLILLVSLSEAQALPLFSRQTGQNCVACHAGGQYPELTPYGRYFKLTGYTIGERTNVPVSVQYVAGAATSTNGNNGTGQVHQSGKLESNYLFLDVGGKIADNFGASVSGITPLMSKLPAVAVFRIKISLQQMCKTGVMQITMSGILAVP
jgi:hypothetical protein